MPVRGGTCGLVCPNLKAVWLVPGMSDLLICLGRKRELERDRKIDGLEKTSEVGYIFARPSAK